MQSNPPPPGPAPGQLRSRFGFLLALGILVLLLVAGVGGYLLGASQVGHATLHIQVSDNMNANVSAQVTVNGALVSTLSIAAGATASVDVPVAYATVNGAAFQVTASIPNGPHDSSTVFVNAPSTFVVDLGLG